MAEARRRFRELLDLVQGGETVLITRRDEAIAQLSAPAAPTSTLSLAAEMRAWRDRWGLDERPADDPFADVRDPAPGRDLHFE